MTGLPECYSSIRSQPCKRSRGNCSGVADDVPRAVSDLAAAGTRVPAARTHSLQGLATSYQERPTQRR